MKTKSRRILLLCFWSVTAVAGFYLGSWTYQTLRADAIYARLGSGNEWIGRWDSVEIGDGGSLKLRIERREDGKYRTIWLAEHYGLCKAAYDEVLDISERDDGVLVLSGSINLGVANGGTYKYHGTIIGDRLEMTWRSSADHGRLILRREEATTKENRPEA